MDEWKKPPKSLVKKKKKFPIKLFLAITLSLFFSGIIVLYLLFGNVIGIQNILVIWSFFTFVIAIILLSFIMVLLRYSDKKDFNF